MNEAGVVLAVVLGGAVLLLPFAAVRARRLPPAARRFSRAEAVLDRALARAAESGRPVEVAAVGGLHMLPTADLRSAETWAAAVAARRTAAAAARHGVATRAAAGDVISAEVMARSAGAADATAVLRAHGDDLAYAAATLADGPQQPPAAVVQVGSLGGLYPLAAAGYPSVPQIALVSDAVSAAYAESADTPVLVGEQVYTFDPSLRDTAAVKAREAVQSVIRTILMVLVPAGVVLSAVSRLGWLTLPWFGV